MLHSNPDRQGALRLGAAALLPTLIFLGGCSSQQREPSGKVDIANAASAARESIGNYARSEQAPETMPSPAPKSPVALATPKPSPAATPTPAVAGEPDAQQAADVLRSYHALIAQRRYRAAWQLWDRGGAASGMSVDAFAAGFGKYRDYKADVGTPGRIDAGAGQRYVTIPVTVSGTMRDGRPFTLEGPMILHRAGNIDGATATQRSWRVYDSGLKPRQTVPPVPDKVTARYRCTDGTAFRATFDNVRDVATLVLPGDTIRLDGQRPASGIWYAGQGHELRGKGDDATLKRPNAPTLTCRADD